MRPVMHGDVVAAARVLRDLPLAARGSALFHMLKRAGLADQHRLKTGRLHPFWGDGSLMSVALAASPAPEPRLDDRDYCSCLALVFETLVKWVSAPTATRARS